MQVRAADPADAAAIAEFARLLIAYNEDLDEDLRLSDHLGEARALPQRYPAPASALLLAYEGERAVGCVVVRAVDARTAEIKRLYVEPAARGAGTARALVLAALQFARDRKHERVVLDTEAERLRPAYSLYRSLGFTPCAPYADAGYANPTFLELAL